MEYKKISIGLLLWAFGPTFLFADVRLETSVQPREARVGDPVLLTVTAHFSTGEGITPPPEERNLGAFEVLSFMASPARKTEAGMVQDFLYKLTVFEAGVSTIPALGFGYSLAGGTTGQVLTPEIPVNIQSVLPPDAADIKEIKGPWPKTVWWGLALFILLCAAGLGFYFWRKKEEDGETEEPLPPPRPAHEAALESLAQLENDPGGTAEIFYVRLSEILRTYVQDGFQVPALDRTTAELFQELRRRGWSMDMAMAARDALEISDLAKFAKWEPTEQERRNDLAKVRDFILRSRAQAAGAPA